MSVDDCVHANAPHSAHALAQARPSMSCILPEVCAGVFNNVTYVVPQALLISVIVMALKWLEEVRISGGIFSSVSTLTQFSL